MCQNFMKTCSKHVLIVLNVLFFILGIGVLGLGTWISVDKTSLFDLVSNSTIYQNSSKSENENVTSEVNYYFTIASLGIIGTGAFIILLSLVGCCGAIKESKCLLITYAVVVILVTLVQSVGIILSAVYQPTLKTHISIALKPTLQYYGYDQDRTITEIWDIKMKNLHCCGVDGYKDFIGLNTTSEIAEICCIGGPCNTGNIEQNGNKAVPGCVDKVFSDLKEQWMHAIIVAGVIILTEILGIALALGLSNSMGNHDDEDEIDGMRMEGRHGRIDSMFSG